MRDMTKGDGSLGTHNVLLALAVGIITCAVIFVWGVPGLDPSLWNETAVAAGIRPPRTIFPGYWRILSKSLFAAVGVDSAVGMLSVVGIALGGICSALVFLIARQVLALLIRTGKTYPVWHRFIAPFFAFVAALLFGISDPFSNMARVFSPDELRFLILLVGIHLTLRWFVIGGNWRIFLVMALMGLMAAETPFAFLLPVLFFFAYRSVWNRIMDGLFEQPEQLPDPEDLPKWRMFFLFLGGLALGVWANAMQFVSLGGLEANGWDASNIYFRYGGGYWHVLADAGTLLGWVLGLGFCVLPLLVTLRLFPLVVRDDRSMPFNLGVSMFFVGAMAVMQCGAFPSARFWTFTKDVAMVPSNFLLVFFVFCAMIAIALFGAAFAFECQRTYLAEDEESAPPPGPLLKATGPLLAVAVVALALVHVPKPVETEMQRIVDEAIDETVEECGDAKYLFTDGNLDTAIELVAAKKGKPLRTLNMMSGATEWEINLRRNLFDKSSEDYKSAETGVPVLLRIWAGEKPGGMDDAAIQLGFEFWKREKKPLPTISGLVARTRGLDPAAVSNGVARANALAERILELSPKLDSFDPSPALANALWSVNWRLSRLARLREESDLADKLDLANTALTRMLSIIEYERTRTFMQMTPREGLQFALRRANFAEARRYSVAILSYDEDDPEANFAMGMSALMMKQMNDAERYLKRVLKKRPNEPAALNNLSIIYRKQKRWKEAEDFARRAMKLLPDSPEVRQTLSDALKKAP
ncbi:MAG: tetratricopeptide repeat protein [Kiritimatiellae bacterium]|nr:tetratricopeptide repeat protein [Kiritimatiellia bacterium]MBQ6328897.1 tetratricopeptide repeat protein [Kiritimatiellia bacterium]